MRVTLLALLLASAACAPTLPPHFAESTEVLAPREVGITVAGGVAGLDTQSKSGNMNAVDGDFVIAAGEVRARVGLGARQEIGISGFAGVDLASKTLAYGGGGKLSYKVAPASWLAFVAGGGAYAFTSGDAPVFGGDLAVILAPYTDPRRGIQVYTGARGSFAIPTFKCSACAPGVGAHGASEGLTIPIGVAIHTAERVRFFVEAGFLAGWFQYRDEPPKYPNDGVVLGGYGLVAVTFIIR